ncbi:hypothetical protein PMAYCL1PPCAC_00471, partial [Pristionchus mayeri]
RMSYESFSGVQCIFYKHKQSDEVIGPFTEQEILEKSLENKELFGYLTSFHVMTDGIKPHKQSIFTTIAGQDAIRGILTSASLHAPQDNRSLWELKLLPIEMGIRMLNLKSKGDFVKVYLDICKVFQTGKTKMIEMLSNHFFVLEDDFMELPKKEKELVFKELYRQLTIKTELYCSYCNVFMFTVRQKVYHMASPHHFEM